jgi:PEP-CTERM motif
MKKLNFKTALSAVSLISMLMIATSVKAAPVRFEQVVQVVNAKPGKANSGGFTKLRVAGDDVVVSTNDGDGKEDPPVQQERMITEVSYDVVEDEACNCDPINVTTPKGKFPYWTILAAAGAIPVAVVLLRKKDKTPTPTPFGNQTPTPTATATVTPTMTPTMTPTPTEPVPEPITLLLFGTGLAGIGVAARRRLRKREDSDETED